MKITYDKKTWSVILLIASALLLAYNWFAFDNNAVTEKSQTASGEDAYFQKVRIRDATVTAELVWTPEDQQMGLSGRESLPEDGGMLFVFPRPGVHGFWMKDMKFAIDIIWISYENKVAGFVENATPESFPETFPSTDSTRYALEVNAGFIKKYGIRVGDIVRISELPK